MAKYRKKPVVVEAEQWFPGKHVDGVVQIGKNAETGKPVYGVHTLEGVLACSPGDYIITGVKGEKYPCKPDIFEATYEPADTPPTDSSAAQAEVARLRAALERIVTVYEECDCTAKDLYLIAVDEVGSKQPKVANEVHEALSTTTESKQDKTCVMCGTREGKYLSTANRWFCEPCTDALPPVNANAAKVELLKGEFK